MIMSFNQQSEKNLLFGMKMSILHTAGLKNAPAHKVQEDYIYEHTSRSKDLMLFTQKYQGINCKISVVTVLYLLLPSQEQKPVSTDEEGGREQSSPDLSMVTTLHVPQK